MSQICYLNTSRSRLHVFEAAIAKTHGSFMQQQQPSQHHEDDAVMQEQPHHQQQQGPEPAAQPPGSSDAAAPPPASDGNVDKWWLSESSEEGEDGSAAPAEALPEDNLYDPDADEIDEAWAQQQRASGRASDALLSCPGCFTSVCIDCQQHEHYTSQYRAMLTINCEVRLDQPIRSSQAQRRQQQRRGKRKAPPSSAQPGAAAEQQPGASNDADDAGAEVLHPVCCAVCGTQVGVRDAQEVVHFFHVLASES